MPAYISSLGTFLPGDPVAADEVESYIGAVAGGTAVRDHVLKSSGIRHRHYVIDREQQTRFSSVDLATNAITDAMERRRAALDDIDLLAVATSSGDLIGPALANMVHGRIQSPPCEVISVNGLCCAGMMALKAAARSVEAGEHQLAVAAASEITSRLFKASRYSDVHRNGEGELPFDMAFLRYLLSDGAGAAVVEPKPAPSGLSFRIDWITLRSYANTTKPCMYIGTPDQRGEQSWQDYPSFADAAEDGAIALRQDMRLLPRLIKTAAAECERLVEAGMLKPEEIDRVAVHYSTEALKPAAFREFARRGLDIAADKWFSNLPEVGNIGCAAILVILEELLRDGGLEPGQKVLCFVPESGRFSISFAQLTVVGPEDA